ncbi:TlpA family protein disulfide reductase [Terrimonas sp. NA20]|uniref:TlpA family protein disulfide reductase n=1 Tax=Terrimonas ginsenosidimutans TaxID=2908004 RepID=A0ABS9KQ15_9BACT|nr:TlpA disulfide reductase family protein [Terrimonas ginsenosidimutans]MCG2614399.1 TlpA family protein disulfide reductase [Terrimonas ginsenosidimutans]
MEKLRNHIVLFAFAIGLLFLAACQNERSNNNSKEASPDVPAGEIMVKETKPAAPIFSSITELINYYKNAIDSLSRQEKRAQDPELIMKLSDSSYVVTREQNNHIYAFLAEHDRTSENFYALRYLVIPALTDVRPEQLDSLFQSFPDSMRKTANGRFFAEQIRLKKIWSSQQTYDPSILDLVFMDTSGGNVRLKDIPGKYLLLDFWSSWCAPCRVENRYMVTVADQIQADGKIALVAFSLDDKKHKWIEATGDDKLNYISLSDLKAFDSPLVTAFKIDVSKRGIPFSVMIDKNGNIIRGGVSREELMQLANTLP